MIKKVKVERIYGDLEMVSSKSLFHRYLIMSSRNKGTKILFNRICDDVRVTIDALKAAGAKITVKDNQIIISNFEKIKENEVYFSESGSSLRFLLPYFFIEEGMYRFKAGKRLSQRPIDGILKELRNKKVKFSKVKLPFTGIGKLEGSFFMSNADVSSQYVSGLMMSGTFLNDKTQIDLKSNITSTPYIEMTAQVIEDFGYKVDFLGDRIIIEKVKEKTPTTITIEGDWSNSLVAIGLAILKGELEITGLYKDSYQGDSNLVTFLDNAGADIKWVKDKLIVKKSKLKRLDMDIDNNIDAFPVLSVLALSCKEKSIFRNISRLRFKESNRIESVLSLHKKLGAKSFVKGKDFVVVPSELKSCVIDSYDDHRIVMAAVVASALADIEIRINNFEVINKSYPGFEKDMKSIGLIIGDVNEI